MTPAEKAKSLLEEFKQTGINVWEAKACAKIAVNEILKFNIEENYWQEVRHELIKPSQAAQPSPGQVEK